MAKQYLVSDRNQLYLLPPSMRDWVAGNHLVWFVLDAVGSMDTSAFHARRRRHGPGRPAYNPDQMLALLIYAYANGVQSSRVIQSLCSSDAAFRVICGHWIPDHATIARFRAEHQDAFKQVFVEILKLCAAEGLASLETVAIDGTKIEANAAMSANREAKTIAVELERTLKEAEAADAEEQARMGRRSSRLSHLRGALAELEVQQQRAEEKAVEETANAREAAAEGRLLRGKKPSEDPYVELERARIEVQVARERATRPTKSEAQGRRRPGPKPRPDAPQSRSRALLDAEARLEAAEIAVAVAARTAKVNVTDPQSRIMKTRTGFLQAYNAQGAVNSHQIVLADDVTQDANDVQQFGPMVEATQCNGCLAGIEGGIDMSMADAGYWSVANATAPGPQRLIATTKDHQQRRAAREMGVCVGPPPPDASPLEAMEHRLRTPEGAAAYALRSQTVEPVFGIIKATLNFRRFSRRGLAACRSEWSLVCGVHNLRKLFLHRLRTPRPAAALVSVAA